jgi:hypothetical protein
MFTSLLLLSGLAFAALASTNYSLPAVYSTTGECARSRVVRLDKLAGAQSYSLLFSVSSKDSLSAEAGLTVSVVESSRVLLQKTLHAGDTDLYVSFRTARPAAPNPGWLPNAHPAVTRCRSIDGPNRPLESRPESLLARSLAHHFGPDRVRPAQAGVPPTG